MESVLVKFIPTYQNGITFVWMTPLPSNYTAQSILILKGYTVTYCTSYTDILLLHWIKRKVQRFTLNESWNKHNEQELFMLYNEKNNLFIVFILLKKCWSLSYIPWLINLSCIPSKAARTTSLFPNWCLSFWNCLCFAHSGHLKNPPF